MTLRQLLLPSIPGSSSVTLERWYKQPGDVITPGDLLLLVRTASAVLDLPVPLSCTLVECSFAVGDTVSVGAVLATIDLDPAGIRPGETVPRRFVTPLARKLATVHAYDLAAINGSGYGGRIVRADLIRLQGDSAKHPTPPPLPLVLHPTVPSRLLAQLTMASHQPPPAISPSNIPVAMTCMTVELDAALVTSQAVARLRRAVPLTPLICVAYAVAQALLVHRLLMLEWSAAGLLLRSRAMLAIEEQGQRRVIQDPAALSLVGLARAVAQAQPFVETGRPFTIRAGSAWWTEPSLAPGCAATLTLGAGTVQPVVVTRHGADRVEQRTRALLTLSYDARLLAQPDVDAFLRTVQHRMVRINALYATLAAE